MFFDKFSVKLGHCLGPKALAIAHGQVRDDGAVPRALFVCPGHSQGPGQVRDDGAIPRALMAMARP